MFKGLSGMEWLFIVAALAFRFGLVKFMLSQSAAKKAPTSTVPWIQQYEPVVVKPLKEAGGPVMAPGSSLDRFAAASHALELLASGVSSQAGASQASPASPRKPWFEVLGGSETASAAGIVKAAQSMQAIGIPDSTHNMLTELRAVRGAVGEGRSANEVDERIEDIERQLSELALLLIARLRETDDARSEGMSGSSRKSPGRSDNPWTG